MKKPVNTAKMHKNSNVETPAKNATKQHGRRNTRASSSESSSDSKAESESDSNSSKSISRNDSNSNESTPNDGPRKRTLMTEQTRPRTKKQERSPCSNLSQVQNPMTKTTADTTATSNQVTSAQLPGITPPTQSATLTSSQAETLSPGPPKMT